MASWNNALMECSFS